MRVGGRGQAFLLLNSKLILQNLISAFYKAGLPTFMNLFMAVKYYWKRTSQNQRKIKGSEHVPNSPHNLTASYSQNAKYISRDEGEINL